MKIRRKPGIVFLVIILAAANLLGQIKAKGKFLILTAGGVKPYDGVLTVNNIDIRIECDKKIFQRFNEFDAPKDSKIIINKAEIRFIHIQENKVYIATENSFTIKYRNVFRRIYTYMGLFVQDYVCFSLIFDIDDVGVIQTLGQKLKKLCPKDEGGPIKRFRMSFFP